MLGRGFIVVLCAAPLIGCNGGQVTEAKWQTWHPDQESCTMPEGTRDDALVKQALELKLDMSRQEVFNAMPETDNIGETLVGWSNDRFGITAGFAEQKSLTSVSIGTYESECSLTLQ